MKRIKWSIAVVFVLAIALIWMWPRKAMNTRPWTEKVPFIDRAYTKQGRVWSYSFDSIRPKVVTNYDSPHDFAWTYEATPPDKVNRIIQENPDYEFIFYLVMQPADTSEVLTMFEKYNVTYPVIFDYDTLFNKATNTVDPFQTSSYLYYDTNAKLLGRLGDPRSFFDSFFADAKQELQNR